MKKIAFVFSGRGSLLNYIQEQINSLQLNCVISLIITNNPNVNRQMLPISNNCEFHFVDHKKYASRELHENEITRLIDDKYIDLIVLGGYRRVFTNKFVDKYGHITMNTHPSLLPAFVGDKAQLMAIKRGVRITGATVHFINNIVDCGPIITQVAVNVLPHYSESDLKEAIIQQEKKAVVLAIKLFVENRLKIVGSIVEVLHDNVNDMFI